MTSRNKISEQIERLYMRSFGETAQLKPRIERREIELLVDQVANSLLAIEPRQGSRLGVVDIPTCMIATYTGQQVSVANGVYSCVLPAFPIRLPLDMGVWSVAPEPSGQAFIPVKTEFWDLLSIEDEGLLEDQCGFYVEGRKIIFTRNPVSATVKIKLLIVDVSQLDKFDPYPVSADMEKEIIQHVLSLLLLRPAGPERPKG